MAKTTSSTRGVQQKKIVPVKPYKKKDGTRVSGHRRSLPTENGKTTQQCPALVHFFAFVGALDERCCGSLATTIAEGSCCPGEAVFIWGACPKERG